MGAVESPSRPADDVVVALGGAFRFLSICR